MRTQRRNSREFWYANFISKRRVMADDGSGSMVATNEWEPVYSEPARAVGNISAAKGSAEIEVFGSALAFDRSIAMESPETPIDEFSVLWIDTMPEFGEDGENAVRHDYIVNRVARSLNSSLVAVSKVDVS